MNNIKITKKYQNNIKKILRKCLKYHKMLRKC